MAGTLMLVNPKARRKAKKPRTAAQKAATKRMIAANRSKGRRPRKATKRRSNPVGLARVSRPRASATTYKRRRRNPAMSLKAGKLGELVIEGLKGAAGSVAVNAAVSYLPAQFVTGKAVYATRAAVALLIGTFGRKVLGKHARTVAEGALTVNFADLINSTAGAMLPGSTLHGVGGVGQYLSMYQASAAVPRTRADSTRRMNEFGEYVS